jgi:hypothetical protein
MSRCALARFLGFSAAPAALAFVLAGCSGDAKDGDGDRSNGAGGSAATDRASDGSPTGNAGSGPGVSSSAGPGGSGGGPSAATYTAAQACQRFAQASCSKGLECGLVLAQTGSALICVQCDALSLGIIQQACEQDLSGDKNAAEVDRCLANLTAQPCAEACVNPEVDGCDVFAELTAGRSNTVVCDSRCVAAAR